MSFATFSIWSSADAQNPGPGVGTKNSQPLLRSAFRVGSKPEWSPTRTPESCWFAVWEGFGDLRIRDGEAPVVSIPQRDLFLLHGMVDEVLTTFSVGEWSYQSPTLWWPDDRAWCVATVEALPTSPEQGNWMEK